MPAPAAGVGCHPEVTRIMAAAHQHPCQLAAYRLSDVAELQRLVEAVHNTTRSIHSSFRSGLCASPLVTAKQPCPLLPWPIRGGWTIPRALSARNAARWPSGSPSRPRSPIAGADGVELHGAQRYLINEFSVAGYELPHRPVRRLLQNA